MAARRLILTIALALSASHWPSLKAPRPVHEFFPPRPDLQDMEKKPVSRDSYVGDETCGSCHREKVESFTRTAHHLTSRQASADSIAGTFGSGANILKTSNPGLFFRMDGKDGRFFQTALWGIPPSTTARTEPIDLVIGSGRKGQTYLFWKGDRLFQLPVSYWIELGQWVNSPGYRDGVADFDRPVMSRCLECHASYADSLVGPQPNNRYKKTSVVLGITCERCHGPGRKHVTRHQSGSADPSAEAIVNPARLPRDRDVEVCAQCHAGMRWPIAAAFSYVPGERLDDYLERDRSDPNSKIDVHGGQVALLKRSRCYEASATMTCSTCHNVHESQRDAAAFSGRCLTCHKMENCGMYSKIGAEIAINCIDCHMPAQQSNAIVSDSNGKQIKPRVRSHWIKVYPETGISRLEESGAGGRVKVQ
jgi:Cytochrome c554 and c-prime